jgi:DNA-binding transcriptional ArsR family regulator
MDEGLRWIQSNSESKNAMDKNLLSDIMGIWGLSDPVLLGLATKKKEDRSPTIHNPHLSIVGCGTTEKLETLLRKSPSFVEDGTLSRFDFVLSDYAEPVSMLRKRPEFLVGHDLNSILISIAQKGIQHADVIDTKAQTKTDRTIYKKPVPVEFFDDEVAALWDDTQQAWSRRSRGQDRLASSIWNRAAEKALRVACLLAIVDSPENPVVTQAHIEWGLAWQEYLATQTSELVIGRVGQTDESRAREEILAALKNGHRTLGRIQKLSRFLSSVDRRVIVAAIDTLRDQGLVSTEKSQRGGIRLTPIDLA